MAPRDLLEVTLGSIGNPVSTKDHLGAVLDDLLEGYNVFTLSVNSSVQVLNAHEATVYNIFDLMLEYQIYDIFSFKKKKKDI